MKHTVWNRLDAERATITGRRIVVETGYVYRMKIKHPDLPRSRWFHVSKLGNWYSRYTGDEVDAQADGYVVVGQLRV